MVDLHVKRIGADDILVVILCLRNLEFSICLQYFMENDSLGKVYFWDTDRAQKKQRTTN